MRNRKVILSSDPCDLLKSINKGIRDNISACIIDCLSGKKEGERRCLNYFNDNFQDCYRCIEDWMNEENITGGSFIK